jgi:hypothetical protein
MNRMAASQPVLKVGIGPRLDERLAYLAVAKLGGGMKG